MSDALNYNTLIYKIRELESVIDDLQASMIGGQTFIDQPPKSNNDQLIFGGFGGTTEAHKPFEIRIASHVEEGETEAKQWVDIYNPIVVYHLYDTTSDGYGINVKDEVFATCANELKERPDGWFSICTLKDVKSKVGSTARLWLDLTNLRGDLKGNDRKYTIHILNDNKEGFAPGSEGEMNKEQYAITIRFANLLYLSMNGQEKATQKESGSVTVDYDTNLAFKLYAKFPNKDDETKEDLVSDFTDRTFKKDTPVYLAQEYKCYVTFGDNKFPFATPVLRGQSQDFLILSSCLPCKIHAADHYDDLIPEPKEESEEEGNA